MNIVEPIQGKKLEDSVQSSGEQSSLETLEAQGALVTEIKDTAMFDVAPIKRNTPDLDGLRSQSMFLDRFRKSKTSININLNSLKGGNISPYNFPKNVRRSSSLTDIKSMFGNPDKHDNDVMISKLHEEDCNHVHEDNKDCDEECSCRMCSCSSCCEDSKCDNMSCTVDVNDVYPEDNTTNVRNSPSKDHINLNERKCIIYIYIYIYIYNKLHT